MLGQYSCDSCYIIQGIPTDCATGLKFNCDDNFCTALLSALLCSISVPRTDNYHEAISQEIIVYFLAFLSFKTNRLWGPVNAHLVRIMIG